VGASEFEVSAALKVMEREGLISRGGRGEGRYGITMLPGASTAQPRSPEARALLAACVETFGLSGKGSTELPLLGRRSGLSEDVTRHALGLLEKAGCVLVARPFAGRAISVLQHEPWHALGVDLERLRAQERNQLLLLKRMTDYAYAKRCRRAYLLRYFGEEQETEGCGTCDVCAGSRLLVPPKGPVERRAGPGERVVPERYSTLAAEELRRWRRELAQDLGVPPFIIFNDATLFALAAALPTSREEFLEVKGTGEARWERFGPRVCEICLLARAAGDEPQRAQAGVAPARRRR
jgi:ATP-dependent DNA helicase RecQ